MGAQRTGKEEDVEVGLQYFGKRYYAPLLNRWVSADPLAVHVPGRADFNLYAYVSGMALKATDPLGLECVANQSCEATASTSEGGVQYGGGGESAVERHTQGGLAPVRAAPIDAPLASGRGDGGTGAMSLGTEGARSGEPAPAKARTSFDRFQEGEFWSKVEGSWSLPIVDDAGMTVVPYETTKDHWRAPPIQPGIGDELGPTGGKLMVGVALVGRDWSRAISVGVETRAPTLTEGLEVADALAWELRAELSKLTGNFRVKPPIVVGKFDPAASEAGAFAARADAHAEVVATESMPKGMFSRPISVRGGTYADVCPECEGLFGREAFVSGTTFKNDAPGR